MRRYLKELKPTEINDIIAMVSLYRPGPMPWIPMYIKGKHDSTSVVYIHKSFEPILKETYGVAVYQEQILQIAREFAGFSLGEADILRKAVGKKIRNFLKENMKNLLTAPFKKDIQRNSPKMFLKKLLNRLRLMDSINRMPLVTL